MREPDTLQIILRPIESLIPYVRNARRHEPWQIDMIAASVQEFGWTNPVLIADDGILAGHGRVMAAQKLGIRRVPCIDLSHLTDTQRRAYVLADNRLAEKGTSWDLDLLKAETDALLAEGYDIELTGFSTDDLAELLAFVDAPEPEKDPDAAPDLPEDPHSQPGDVWICGPHRIICGDSTQDATWQALMGTELGDCVLTDPPYGVSYQAKGKKAIANDDLTGDSLRRFLREVNVNLFARLKPGASAYVFHADGDGLAFRQSLTDAGFKLSQCLIWVKDSLVLGRSRYQWRHEPCLLVDKPGGKRRWWGGRKQTTVIEMGDGSPFEQLEDGRFAVRNGDDVLIVEGAAKVVTEPSTIIRHPKPKRSDHHPTQKPVGMLCRLLRNSARPNDLVLEPFSGSGSTMMAAETLGMCARAAELDPGYVDVAVMRWQAFTGRAAVHADTGAKFPVPPEKCVSF